jgi:MFS family permease
MNKPLPSSSAAAASPPTARHIAMWLVLLAAGGTFALTMGVRQTMGLFLLGAQHVDRLGMGSISLAFAFGQLWWGLTQPFAGAVADRIGTGRVLVAVCCWWRGHLHHATT